MHQSKWIPASAHYCPEKFFAVLAGKLKSSDLKICKGTGFQLSLE
jgi:hypothetical protein